MATIGDKFSKVSTGVRPLTTTVDGTRATSGATLTCADLTGWDTDTAVHGVTYKIDGQGAIVAGSQIDFKGIVSGNTITNFTVTGGTDVGNAVGDIVQATPTAAWAKDLADGLLLTLDQDGTIKAGGVDNAAALASNVVTTAKILDSNVTTAKIADNNITAPKLATDAISLGKTSVTSALGASGAASPAAIGVTKTVTIPAGGRDVEVSVHIPHIISSGAINVFITLWDGTVGSGTQLCSSAQTLGGASYYATFSFAHTITAPAAGSKTYSVGYHVSAGSITGAWTATNPATIAIKVI